MAARLTKVAIEGAATFFLWTYDKSRSSRHTSKSLDLTPFEHTDMTAP
jgi:hypothetical protein